MIIHRAWLLFILGTSLSNLIGSPLTLINNTPHEAKILANKSKIRLMPTNGITVAIVPGNSFLCIINGIVLRIEYHGSSSSAPVSGQTCELQTILMMAGYFDTPLDSITLTNDTWYPVHCKDLNPDSLLFGELMVIEPGEEITKNAQHRSKEKAPTTITPLYGIIGLTQDGGFHTLKYPRRRYFSNAPMTCVWLNQQVSLATFFLFNDTTNGWRYSVVKELPKGR